MADLWKSVILAQNGNVGRAAPVTRSERRLLLVAVTIVITAARMLQEAPSLIFEFNRKVDPNFSSKHKKNCQEKYVHRTSRSI